MKFLKKTVLSVGEEIIKLKDIQILYFRTKKSPYLLTVVFGMDMIVEIHAQQIMSNIGKESVNAIYVMIWK